MPDNNFIYNDRYVLTYPQDIQHNESMSGNGTYDNPLGLNPYYQPYNETVLWNGSQLVSSTNLTGTLSEAPSGFERIGVYWRQSYSNIMGFLEVPAESPIADQWYISVPMSQWGIGGATDGTLYCDRGNVNIPISGDSLKWSAFGPYERVTITTGGNISRVTQRGPTLTKIIGINKKQ